MTWPPSCGLSRACARWPQVRARVAGGEAP